MPFEPRMGEEPRHQTANRVNHRWTQMNTYMSETNGPIQKRRKKDRVEAIAPDFSNLCPSVFICG